MLTLIGIVAVVYLVIGLLTVLGLALFTDEPIKRDFWLFILCWPIVWAVLVLEWLGWII